MPDSLINRRLGKYLIQQLIGRGGMARVYRATDTVLQRTVALKILAPQIGNDPDLAKRFEREAITAANLRHPAIITIFDVGEAEGLRYIAMEYVAGRTLADVLVERGILGLPLTISVLQPVAEALQHAHTQGAVHRDVKPQNIMIDTDGRVLLTDFGIALGPSQQSQKLTQAGLFMGTPEYISPEQAQGQDLNGLSDLYSLGIVAYEMLAGRVPFSGGIPQLLMAHVYTPPPPITTLNPELPLELDQVFARVLAKPPSERLGKTTSFVEALRLVGQRHGMLPATLSEVATLATPQHSSAGQSTVLLPSQQAQSPTAVAPDPIVAVFGASSIGRVAGVNVLPGNSTAGHPQNRAAPPHQAPPMVYPQASEPEFVPRRRPRPAAARTPIPWPGIIAVLLALLIVGIVISRTNPSHATNPSSISSSPRSNPFSPPPPAVTNMATIVPVDVGNPTPVPTNVPLLPTPTSVQSTSAVPQSDGELLAPTSTQTPTPKQLPPIPAASATPHVSTATALPHTATSEPTMTVLPPTDTPLSPTPTLAPPTPTSLPSMTPAPATPTTPPPAATLPPGAPTPTGGATHLVTQSGNAVLLFDVTANKRITIAADASSIGPAAISPDGQTVLFDALQQGKRRIMRYETNTGTVSPLLKGDGGQEMYHPAWSPDGSRIIFVSTAGGNPNLYVLSTRGNAQVQRLTSSPAIDDYPSFSPDGTQIIFESNRDSGKYALFLLDAAGPHRFSPVGQPFDDRYPRFAPDGAAVVFTSTRERSDGGSEIYIQPLVGDTARRLTTFTTGSASGPDWSPDGRLIAFFGNATGSNHVYVISVNGGTPTDLAPNSTADERWPVWGK